MQQPELESFNMPMGDIPTGDVPTGDVPPQFNQQQAKTKPSNDWYSGEEDPTGDAGSAIDSFPDSAGESFKIPDYIALEQTGFTYNSRQKTGNKTSNQKTAIKDARGLLIRLSDGASLGHNSSYYELSQVFLSKAQQKLMQTILNSQWPGVYQVPRMVSAYGVQPTGIIELDGFKPSVWDMIVNGINNREDRFAQFYQRDNTTFFQEQGIRSQGAPQPLTFLNGRYAKSSYMYVSLEGAVGAPAGKIPNVSDDACGLVFRMTGFQSGAFKTLIRAFAVVVANKLGESVSDLIRSQVKLQQEIQKHHIHVTMDTVDSNYGPKNHPRFWLPTKQSYGMSIWEALCDPQMSVALKPTDAPAKLPQEEIERLWSDTVGVDRITQNQSTKALEVSRAPDNDPRRNQ